MYDLTVDDEVLAFHPARGDFSRWLRDAFADRALAGQVAKIERRWHRREIHDLRHELRRPVADAIKRAQPPLEAGRPAG